MVKADVVAKGKARRFVSKSERLLVDALVNAIDELGEEIQPYQTIPSKFEQSPNGTSAKATSTGSPRRRMRSMSVGTAMSFAPGGVSGRPFEPRATQKAEPGGRAQFTLVNLLPKSF